MASVCARLAPVDDNVKRELVFLAERYETSAFYQGVPGDPSRFMHEVEGNANREAVAFFASCLSFGSRAQFMPKIKTVIDLAGGDLDSWIRRGGFAAFDGLDRDECFYRFFKRRDIFNFFAVYRRILKDFGTLGGYVRIQADGNGIKAVSAICRAFGSTKLVPADAKSACKRVCMFLRWMTRDASPVDIGLWADFIDRRTLAMPLDVHVVKQAMRLGLLKSACTSMSAARRLASTVAQVFPDDPLKADFALFGYGANTGK